MSNVNNVNNILNNINNDTVNNINKTFNKITENYNNISSKIENSLNNYSIPYSIILDLDVSMTDLDIQLQSILFQIGRVENQDCGFTKTNTKNYNTKTYNTESINNQEIKSSKEYKEETNTQNDEQKDEQNDEQFDKKIKTDKLVDKTLKKMLPFFLLCLMMIDNESILNSKTFCQSNNDNDLKYQSTMKMLDIELD